MGLNTYRAFFLTVYEYIEILDKEDRFIPVAESIKAERAQDWALNDELGKKAAEEMRSTYQALKAHVEKAKIENAAINELLRNFEQYEQNDGTIEFSAGSLTGKHQTLIRAFIVFAEMPDEKEKAFAQQFGEVEPTTKLIGRFTFSPSYFEREKEQKRLERLQLTKLWYSYDRLGLFYTIYRDFEKLREQYIGKGNFFSAWGIDELNREVQSIMDSRDDRKAYIREFQIPAYKAHLQRLHMYTKERLLTLAQAETEKREKLSWTYDPDSGVLYLNSKIVQFKKNNFRAKVLELLTKNDKNKRKTWSWDEVYEVIEGKEGSSAKEKRQVYEACKGLAEQIAAKSGITDFLFYDTNTARINPTWL